ncbi:hypothetical protein R6Q57_017525 [Mikania cordata]
METVVHLLIGCKLSAKLWLIILIRCKIPPSMPLKSRIYLPPASSFVLEIPRKKLSMQLY